jgi:hypothetical protein
MRNFIVLIVALIILIAAGIWQINYIEESSTYATSDVEYITNLIRNNNFTEASKQVDVLEKTWKDMSNIWNIFIIHDEIDNIQEVLVNFKMYTKLEDKEEALVYSELLIQNFTHISKKQKIRIENVF